MITTGPSTDLRTGFQDDAPETLDQWSREASWYVSTGELVRCELCPQLCILGENDRGYCRARVVKDQKLHTLTYGNPCSIHVDPIEKKPLFHFLPGSEIFSVATAGCNLRCKNCQNWEISQARPDDTENIDLLPERLVETVQARGIPAIAYTYSEPIIFYEYVHDAAVRARQAGIKNVMVTAGYIEERPLRKLCQVIDAANVDLKGFTDRFYRQITGAKLEPVLRALQILHEEGVWFEITRLIVPTLSDQLDDIRAMCGWIVDTLSPDVPIHFSRFHPAYQLKTLPYTPDAVLVSAKDIATEMGLKYVYIGNLPTRRGQHTFCPSCNRRVIERHGYLLGHSLLGESGDCTCGERIPGVWL